MRFFQNTSLCPWQIGKGIHRDHFGSSFTRFEIPVDPGIPEYLSIHGNLTFA